MKHHSSLTRTVFMLGLTVCAAMLSISQLSYAQTGTNPNTGNSSTSGKCTWHHGNHPHQSVDQRLAALKAALQIQTNQEGVWQAYANAVQTASTDRKTLWQQFKQTTQSLTFPQRIQRREAITQQLQSDRQAIDNALIQLFTALTQQQQSVLEQHFAHHHKGHNTNS
jgi:hypothetical protein